jgi:hypothetical protein
VTTLVAWAVPAAAASPNLVISQVYGGNAGAFWQNDFIEIPSTLAIALIQAPERMSEGVTTALVRAPRRRSHRPLWSLTAHDRARQQADPGPVQLDPLHGPYSVPTVERSGRLRPGSGRRRRRRHHAALAFSSSVAASLMI